MTEIQQNRYDRLVRRVTSVVGGGSQVNDTLNELFPMIDVESLVAELLFLSDTRMAFGSVDLAASVGNLNHHQLFNPLGSGNLITLTHVGFESDTAQRFEFDTTTVASTNLTGSRRYRDTRSPIVAQPIGQVRSVQQAGGLPLIGGLFVGAADREVLEDSNGLFVLAPGTGVTFASETANIGTMVSFLWRERVAQTSELNI